VARSVRHRPDPGQLAFLIDLEAQDQGSAVIVSDVRTEEVTRRPDPPPMATEPALEERETAPAAAPTPAEQDWRAILDFERAWSGPLSAKQRAVRDRFGVTSARYHQVLDRTLELPDALTYDPALVARLRRVRETRRSKRSARRVDASGASPLDRGTWGEEGPTRG
jgi:hypothetical protein